MKTISIYSLAVVLSVAITGCEKTAVSVVDEGGIPAVTKISYDLLDGTGSASWFAIPGNTSIDSVKFGAPIRTDGSYYYYRPSVGTRLGHSLLSGEGIESSVAEPGNTGTRIDNRLIVLNQSDTDTLRVEIVQTTQEINLLRFYYNGRLSASYDFRATPGLRDSLFWNVRHGLVVPLRKFNRR